jgi:hypothetical protein
MLQADLPVFHSLEAAHPVAAMNLHSILPGMSLQLMSHCWMLLYHLQECSPIEIKLQEVKRKPTPSHINVFLIWVSFLEHYTYGSYHI